MAPLLAFHQSCKQPLLWQFVTCDSTCLRFDLMKHYTGGSLTWVRRMPSSWWGTPSGRSSFYLFERSGGITICLQGWNLQRHGIRQLRWPGGDQAQGRRAVPQDLRRGQRQGFLHFFIFPQENLSLDQCFVWSMIRASGARSTHTPRERPLYSRRKWEISRWGKWGGVRWASMDFSWISNGFLRNFLQIFHTC